MSPNSPAPSSWNLTLEAAIWNTQSHFINCRYDMAQVIPKKMNFRSLTFHGGLLRITREGILFVLLTISKLRLWKSLGCTSTWFYKMCGGTASGALMRRGRLHQLIPRYRCTHSPTGRSCNIQSYDAVESTVLTLNT